jgi:spermidine/putrescine transport system permease protein
METRKTIGKRRFSFLVTLGVFLLLYIPIVSLIVLSFNSARQGVMWTGFTLNWYIRLFSSPEIWRSFMNTVIVALVASSVATIIGTLSAIGIYWYRFKSRKYFQVLIYTPLIIPDILMGVSMLIFFAALRVPLGLGTVIIAHITFCISYVTIVVITRLEDFDYSVVEAARDLGARSFQVFVKVVIPIIVPGIVAGFLLSVTLSVDDFVITFFVAGPGATTLPLRIYSMIKFGVSPVINALSTLLIGGTLMTALLARRFRKLIIG